MGIEKHYLTLTDVERTLQLLEERFGMTSAEFWAAHYAETAEGTERLVGIPNRLRSTWASLCRTHDRMTGGSLASRIERELELV